MFMSARMRLRAQKQRKAFYFCKFQRESAHARCARVCIAIAESNVQFLSFLRARARLRARLRAQSHEKRVTFEISTHTCDVRARLHRDC